jgi:hypothetical protein
MRKEYVLPVWLYQAPQVFCCSNTGLTLTGRPLLSLCLAVYEYWPLPWAWTWPRQNRENVVFVHLSSSKMVQNEMLYDYDTLIYRTTDLSNTLISIFQRPSHYQPRKPASLAPGLQRVWREAEVENLALFTLYIPNTIILFSYNVTHGKILEYFITAENRPIIYKEDMHIYILHNCEKYLKIIGGKVQRLLKTFS